jgi:hypothetical protein
MTKELKDNFTVLKYFSEPGLVGRANNEKDKKRQIHDSDKLFFTERSLLNLSNCWGPSKFATSGCLAAIIFIDNYLRGIVFHARIMVSLLRVPAECCLWVCNFLTTDSNYYRID